MFWTQDFTSFSKVLTRPFNSHDCFVLCLIQGISTASSLILYPISANACIRNLVNDGVIRVPGWSALQESEEWHSIQRYAYTYYLTWIAAMFFMSSFFCMNLDLIIQSFVRPVPFLSALANYLTCCCRWRRQQRQRHYRTCDRLDPTAASITARDSTAYAQSNHCPTSPRSAAVTEPATPYQSEFKVADKQDKDSTDQLKSRITQIPEILLSSYDEEGSIEGQSVCPQFKTRRKQIMTTSASDEEVRKEDDDEDEDFQEGTGEDGYEEEGGEEEDENFEAVSGEDDDDEGEWI